MLTNAENEDRHIKRLVEAVGRIVDRHCETKKGSGLLYVVMPPHDMKELRSAYEPFRPASGHR